MLFGGALIVDKQRVVGWGRKSYLRTAEIVSYSSRDFSRNNKHDTFCHVVLTGYFYFLFLWAIAVPDFLPLEIYNNLGLSLFTITFKVNSHAGNHFYKYMYLFQILYSMKSGFFFKYTLRFFIFKFDLNVKHRSHFF